MSRGPGRLERAIEAAFEAGLDEGFTIEDLCLLCYPEEERSRVRYNKHGVPYETWENGKPSADCRRAVVRAARKVAKRTGRDNVISRWRSGIKGGRIKYIHTDEVKRRGRVIAADMQGLTVEEFEKQQQERPPKLSLEERLMMGPEYLDRAEAMSKLQELHDEHIPSQLRERVLLLLARAMGLSGQKQA